MLILFIDLQKMKIGLYPMILFFMLFFVFFLFFLVYFFWIKLKTDSKKEFPTWLWITNGCWGEDGSWILLGYFLIFFFYLYVWKLKTTQKKKLLLSGNLLMQTNDKTFVKTFVSLFIWRIIEYKIMYVKITQSKIFRYSNWTFPPSFKNAFTRVPFLVYLCQEKE